MSHAYALLYCRVSSLRQKEEGSGLESQEFRCKERAAQKGYSYEKTFFDSFTGGGDFMKRPAMRELLAHIDRRPDRHYVVIFDDLKRFARDVTFHWQLRRAFQARNTSVECLNFNFEDTPEGEFIETIIAAQGQLERQQNRRQVIQKQKARLERGYWPFFPPPGYRHTKDPRHGKILVPIDRQVRILGEALEGFASGRLPEQVDVQRFLTAKGFSGGHRLHLSTVRRLLERVVYAGYIEYVPWGVTRRPGHHEALISLATYERIQERLRGSVTTFTRKDVRDEFPLRGFLLCARCQRAFTASWSRGRSARYAYYRCKTGDCAERNRHIAASLVDQRFANVLAGVHPRRQALALTRAICVRVWQERLADAGRLIAQHRDELARVEKEKNTLVERIGATTSPIVARTYEQRIEALANRELLLRERLSTSQNTAEHLFGTALDSVLAVLKEPCLQWDSGDLARRRLLLKIIFAEPLVYDREEGFGTAVFSLPVRLFEVSSGSELQLVEMVRSSWNHLFTFISETYNLLEHPETKIDWKEAA